MNPASGNLENSLDGRGKGGRILAALVLLLAVALLLSQAPDLIRPAEGQTVTSLVVQDLQGNPIDEFKYVVNQDNARDSHDPNGELPSIAPNASHSPVVAVGEKTAAEPSESLDLPGGKYVVSVQADGHKLGGERFDTASGQVVVRLEPDPVAGVDPSRLARIQVHVFNDGRILNGEDDGAALDAPLEPGLADFAVVIKDENGGEVTQDYFGNPLGSLYEEDQNGDPILDQEGNPVPVLDADGEPVVETPYTDANGNVTIKNVAPGKYSVRAIEPDGEGWIQTSTIEGTPGIDAWVGEADPGLSEGEDPAARFGFVKEQPLPQDPAVTGAIKGRVFAHLQFVTQPLDPPLGTPAPDGALGDPVESPYVALNAIDQNDELVYVGQGNPDGSFQIDNVPDGNYLLVSWDEPLDYLISFETVTVSNGELLDLGKLRMVPWFAHMDGHVFEDNGRAASGQPIPDASAYQGQPAAGNQVRDCIDKADQSTCEKGIPNADVGTRYKDGSIQAATLTEGDGSYHLDEISPALLRYTVAEVGFGRMGRTGASVRSRYDAKQDQVTSVSEPGALTMSTFASAGFHSRIDWGKYRYTGADNGGISGIVYYASVRNEFDARYAGAEDFEPGIPGVTVNLYSTVDGDADGEPDVVPQGEENAGALVKGDLLNSVQTDSFERPEGPGKCQVRDENDQPVTEVRDANGNPQPYTVGNLLADRCVEAWAPLNQVHDGVFDGGYAFETRWNAPGDPSSGESPLEPGQYIVQVEMPKDQNGNPLYKIVKEEDVNVNDGQNLVPQVPPAPCAGALHTVDVAGVGTDGPDAVENPSFADNGGSPYEGQEMPLCDSKLVTLEAKENPPADFFLFTDVPVPGRIIGLVTDDLGVGYDASHILYGDRPGVPNAPVGIYDYNYRLIAATTTDENGQYEIILPSTGSYNIPATSGVSPNMYHVVANDPNLDVATGNPNLQENTDYGTLDTIWDVWPGKTTMADTAVEPIVPPTVPPEPWEEAIEPQVLAVNQAFVAAGNRNITIQGNNFGANPQVTLDGRPITVQSASPNQITASVPANFPVGPKELLVRADGRTSKTGLTVHVIGGSYRPRTITVNPGEKIQDAINRARGSTVIFVRPGVYHENLILHKGVKLQGSGPGSQTVQGTIIDGGAFQSNKTAWRQLLGSIGFAGNQKVAGGAAITVLAQRGEFTPGFRPAIDGFTIRGARGGPGLIQEARGGAGIFVNGSGRYLDIQNNLIRDNAGFFGGAIVLGNPYYMGNANTNARIRYNHIEGNGGSNLAGAIGIYSGSSNYEVSHNVITGNYGAEYGGGISHYGLSPNGKILDNDITGNYAFDEGGGILVGGELTVDPTRLTPGSGKVTIDGNRIQANVSNDDGGGIRLLNPARHVVNMTNNIVANNVATDHGGGIALDDAPYVLLANNTIAYNLTTNTAEDRSNAPQAAGLTSELHGTPLKAALPAGAPDFSSPTMFNNVLWGNLAGTWNGNRILGIGQPGDPGQPNVMDLGVVGQAQSFFKPTYSILTEPYGVNDPTNKVGQDPGFVLDGEMTLGAGIWNADWRVIAVTAAPAGALGDYHLGSGSPAIDAGVAGLSRTVRAPAADFDGERRPSGTKPDIGADERTVGP